MKYALTLFLLLQYTITFAQNTTHQSEVDALKLRINTETNTTKKLVLLDSLTQLTYNKKELGFDSISRATINYAIQLDSFNLASRTAQDLINFHNNVLGQPEEGITIFNTYFNQVKDHITDRNRAGIYIDAGDSYYFAKKVDTAMAFYDKAKHFANKAGNDRVKAFAILYQGYYIGTILKNNTSNSNSVSKIDRLTPSEIKILKYLDLNYSSSQIAEEIFISKRTVQKHRSNIIKKLELDSSNQNAIFVWLKNNPKVFNT